MYCFPKIKFYIFTNGYKKVQIEVQETKRINGYTKSQLIFLRETFFQVGITQFPPPWPEVIKQLLYNIIIISVADPYHFDADPDPLP